MVTVLIMFGNPIDGDAFERHFDTRHLPLIAAVPGYDELVVHRTAAVVTGEAPYRVVVELRFSSEEAMRQGLNSDAGQRMARDFGDFASGGVAVLLCNASLGLPESA